MAYFAKPYQLKKACAPKMSNPRFIFVKNPKFDLLIFEIFLGNQYGISWFHYLLSAIVDNTVLSSVSPLSIDNHITVHNHVAAEIEVN